jgi:phosphoribosylaminoimidazole carboxylase PurK protein
MSEVKAAVNQGRALRVGLIGGGQLALMLAEACRRQGHSPVVLLQSPDEPAAAAAVNVLVGELDDARELSKLFADVDVVTIENEFLNLDVIHEVMKAHPAVHLWPAPRTIAVAQDKLAQKELWTKLGIPTAPYQVLPSRPQSRDLAWVRERFDGGVVLKWSRFGYDGRGNYLLRSEVTDLNAALAFCAAGEAKGAKVYAEQMIDFAAEVAMISTRAQNAEQVFWPLVLTQQDHGVCRDVMGPAAELGVDPALEKQAQHILAAIAHELLVCGTFAIEFFVTPTGLLVNEMAPRVHNSGHYTLWQDELSQFDSHIQAVTQAPLTKPSVRSLFAMRNLLGAWGSKPQKTPIKLQIPTPTGIAAYWYGKASVSAGRKMGHLTCRASTSTELSALQATMTEYEHALWTKLGCEGQDPSGKDSNTQPAKVAAKEATSGAEPTGSESAPPGA